MGLDFWLSPYTANKTVTTKHIYVQQIGGQPGQPVYPGHPGHPGQLVRPGQPVQQFQQVIPGQPAYQVQQGQQQFMRPAQYAYQQPTQGRPMQAQYQQQQPVYQHQPLYQQQPVLQQQNAYQQPTQQQGYYQQQQQQVPSTPHAHYQQPVPSPCTPHAQHQYPPASYVPSTPYMEHLSPLPAYSSPAASHSSLLTQTFHHEKHPSIPFSTPAPNPYNPYEDKKQQQYPAVSVETAQHVRVPSPVPVKMNIVKQDFTNTPTAKDKQAITKPQKSAVTVSVPSSAPSGPRNPQIANMPRNPQTFDDSYSYSSSTTSSSTSSRAPHAVVSTPARTVQGGFDSDMSSSSSSVTYTSSITYTSSMSSPAPMAMPATSSNVRSSAAASHPIQPPAYSASNSALVNCERYSTSNVLNGPQAYTSPPP